MEPLKQKITHHLSHRKKRHIVGTIILVFCVLMLCLSFFPDFSPIFHDNTFRIFNAIKNNIHNTIPISYLKNSTKQKGTIVIDKPIQSTGCDDPLTIKTGTSTYIEINSGNITRRFIIYLPKGYTNNT